MLAAHPDQQFANFILSGLAEGFRIGFREGQNLLSARRNKPSAYQHPEAVEQYLSKEITAGRLVGPFPPGMIAGVHISRMGVVPKGHQRDKWRVITDLSFPPQTSVNDGVDPAWCSMEYTARAAQRIGRGALLAKLDVASAYRLVLVHPQDRLLLGIQWHDSVYIDCSLPFGLRSAPKMFTALADALEWCFRQHGVSEVDHYLDDFITIDPPEAMDCQRSLSITLDVCRSLSVPLAMEKLEGPVTCLTFLGIEVDTVAGVLRLPREKVVRIKRELSKWLQRRKKLESLISLLQHACQVVYPGRSFLRRMIALLSRARSPHHFICLNQDFRADVHWWQTFLDGWNGVYIFPPRGSDVIEFASDASGSWGCGAWWGARWFQFQWPQEAMEHHTCLLLGASGSHARLRGMGQAVERPYGDVQV